MGGTYNSVVRGGDSLFVNPAALMKSSLLEVKLLGLGVGSNGLDLYNQFKDDHNFKTPADFAKVYGKDVFLGLNAKSSVVFGRFGVAGYSDSYILAKFHSPPNPNFNATYISDYGVVVGGAIPVGPETAVGVAFKRIVRTGGTKDIDLGVLLDTNAREALVNSFKDKGVGYGADVSLMTTLPTAFSPTVVVSWQDVGSTSFSQTDGQSSPPRIKDNLSLGASTTLDLPGFDWTNAVEYKFITHQGEDLGKKLHIGTEISLPFIDLRAGFSQGYTTYGVGLNLSLVRLDAAMYKTELGAYPGQTGNDRLQIGLTIDFSFDADFNIVDSNGKKRSLKQRR